MKNDPILNVLTDDQLHAIHDNYYKGQEVPVDGTLAYRFQQFVSAVAYEEQVRANKRVKLVTGQPYQNAAEMRARVAEEGVLYISTDYNNDPLLPEGNNLNFRTAHDFHHIRSPHCNFELWGEVCAYSKFAEYAVKFPAPLASEFCQILFSEIVAQVVCLRFEGDYAEQRTAFGNIEEINTVHRAYGLPPIK